MGKLKKYPIKDWLGFITGYECPAKEIKIVICEKQEADHIIMKHHYSKKPTKNSFASFLVYWEGKVNGALQLGYGIRPKNKGTFNPDDVREFDRMWLSLSLIHI